MVLRFRRGASALLGLALCAGPSGAWAQVGPCDDVPRAVARPDGVDPASWGATDPEGVASAVTVEAWWAPVSGATVQLGTFAGSALQPVSAGGTPLDLSTLWCSGQSGTFGARSISAAGESASAEPKPYTFKGDAPPPPPPSTGTVQLTIVGDPATGPWGVAAVPADTRDLQLEVRLDGAFHHTEQFAPYGFPDDGATGLFGAGSHVIEFIFSLQDTATEVERGSITVTEGSAPPPPPPPPPTPVCGDGVVNGTEVCDGVVGCSADGFCTADCSACLPPPPPPAPKPVCLAPTEAASMNCAPYPAGTLSLRCYLTGQLHVESCPGVPPIGGETCLTFPTAALYCDPTSDGEQKCRISTKAARLEDCR